MEVARAWSGYRPSWIDWLTKADDEVRLIDKDRERRPSRRQTVGITLQGVQVMNDILSNLPTPPMAQPVVEAAANR
jgi:hypothetical protein